MPNALNQVYPHGAPTTEGPRLTVDTLMKSPTVLPQLIIDQTEEFYTDVLFRQATTDSGTLLYTEAEARSIYPDIDRTEIIDPGTGYNLIEWGEAGQLTAVAEKFGVGYRVTEEARLANRMNVISDGNMEIRNSIRRYDAARLLREFDRKVAKATPSARWDQTDAFETDLLSMQGEIEAKPFGYRPDTVLVNPAAMTKLRLNPAVRDRLNAVHDASLSTLFLNQLSGYLGLNWVALPSVPLGRAVFCQLGVTGVNVTWTPYEVKIVDEPTTDSTLVLAKKRSVPVIDRPQSAVIFDGIFTAA